MPLGMMLRVYFLQQWYALSDPMAEEILHDSDAMRRLAWIQLGGDSVPDETTIPNFRYLLEQHERTEAIFDEVNDHLVENGIMLRSEILMGATITGAPYSTKKQDHARSPEMSSTNKGKNRLLGIKAHVGVDADSSVVHSLDTSKGRVHESSVWDGSSTARRPPSRLTSVKSEPRARWPSPGRARSMWSCARHPRAARSITTIGTRTGYRVACGRSIRWRNPGDFPPGLHIPSACSSAGLVR